MLAAAEADFQGDVVGHVGGPRRERSGRPGAEIERKPRQQTLDQRGLVRPQWMALAPAEEGAVARSFYRLAQLTALRSASARSVFSHEKPPSASGARPK